MAQEPLVETPPAEDQESSIAGPEAKTSVELSPSLGSSLEAEPATFSARSEPTMLVERSLVRLLSGDFFGIEGRPVEVQVDVSTRGTPGFNIVGLAGKSIRESRERIRSAIASAGFQFPYKQRVLVNLAPAGQEKHGSGFDLAIAVGILLASRQAPGCEQCFSQDGLVKGVGFVGELGLQGELRHVPGVLLVAHTLKSRGVQRVVVPVQNAREAALVEGVEVVPAAHLSDALGSLSAIESVRKELARAVLSEAGASGPVSSRPSEPLDFTEVRGQEATKRALAIAAAGGHNVLLSGPPGAGKTMLARRLPGILPPMVFEEAMDVTRILSVLGHEIENRLTDARPFRAPHHTISYAGLVGGGSRLRPGEVTRAHRGVLFLDELPEFHRQALEALREPLEEGHISIGRSAGCVQFPARFLLVGAMNPCPCGYLGHPKRTCACSSSEVRSYRQRISGPLLDRIDLHIAVSAVDPGELITETALKTADPLSSHALRAAVTEARSFARERWGGDLLGAIVPLSRLTREGKVRRQAAERLKVCAERLSLSARGFTRCLRVARTVADLERSERVEVEHVEEALLFRDAGW